MAVLAARIAGEVGRTESAAAVDVGSLADSLLSGPSGIQPLLQRLMDSGVTSGALAAACPNSSTSEPCSACMPVARCLHALTHTPSPLGLCRPAGVCALACPGVSQQTAARIGSCVSGGVSGGSGSG